MDHRLDRDRAMAHHKWRKKVARHLPRIAARVFALRGTGYSGSGLHYAMEHSLGKLIADVTDHGSTITLTDELIEPVLFTELLRDLGRAERSARRVKHNVEPQQPAPTPDHSATDGAR